MGPSAKERRQFLEGERIREQILPRATSEEHNPPNTSVLAQ